MKILDSLINEAAGLFVKWFLIVSVVMFLGWVWSFGSPWSYLMWIPIGYFVYWYLRKSFSLETEPWEEVEKSQARLESEEWNRRHDDYRRSQGDDVDAEEDAEYERTLNRIRRGR